MSILLPIGSGKPHSSPSEGLITVDFPREPNVSKNFSFHKDWDRCLYLKYDGQTLGERHKDLLDYTAENEDPAINEAIFLAFQEYALTKLGAERVHLIDEINSRFSQRHLITFYDAVNKYSLEHFKGLLQNGPTKDNCTLHIPDAVNEPVIITTSSVAQYSTLISNSGKMIELDPPVRLMGYTVYTIGGNEEPVRQISFMFERLEKISTAR